MTQKSLSSETCLGYLSALQVHAFCRRRGIALATTRHRHFPSKAASRDQANDLTTVSYTHLDVYKRQRRSRR